MNRGIEKATGKYIGIVESDDIASPVMFEEMYEMAEKNKVDFVKTGFYFYWSTPHDKDVKHTFFGPADSDRVINPREHREVFRLMPSVWAGLYRREFLNKLGIRFLPTAGASYQDTGFAFKVWASTKAVYVTNNAYLHYRQDNDNSSVKSPGKVFCVADEYAGVEKFLKEHKLWEELAGIMEWCKFNTYYWNINRLTTDKAKEFMVVFSEQFNQAERDGVLDWELFDDYDSKLLGKIMKHPGTFFVARIPARLARKAKGLMARAFHKVSPSYRQQMHIAELQDEIVRQNERLAEKLSDLEKTVQEISKRQKKK
jgi:glycosyltransferase involved in cell wall biosynthesis